MDNVSEPSGLLAFALTLLLTLLFTVTRTMSTPSIHLRTIIPHRRPLQLPRPHPTDRNVPPQSNHLHTRRRPHHQYHLMMPSRSSSSSSSSSSTAQQVSSDSETEELPPFKFFQPPEEPPPPSPLEAADPDLYRIGYARSFRAYGVDFLEGPEGFGVYANRDIAPLRRARLIMEIPLELTLTVSRNPPWLFFPDIIPIGHPIFDIINSTDPDLDWDLRLACLLLFALDVRDNFWQFYGDFLPDDRDCTSLLLATEEELRELQDSGLAEWAAGQRRRALVFWERHWHPEAPYKIRRLATTGERFLWAMSVVQSRAVERHPIRVGALKLEASVLLPYVDMLNHSFQPNCFLHWRYKDRMLEVLINAGQEVRCGEEMTLNYLPCAKNVAFMERYGFSSASNPWETLDFSGNARIHLDSFLSVFKISGLPDEYHHRKNMQRWGDRNVGGGDNDGDDDGFVDGAVIAVARMLPTCSDGDLPPLPSVERRAAKELQRECQEMLDRFPTSLEEDWKILDLNPEASRMLEAAIRYRMSRKLFTNKVMQALDIYQNSIWY